MEQGRPRLGLDHEGAPTWTEAERLAALARYGILDTPSEPLFDDLATLAAEICGTPIAVVNFIASGRQWFKAEQGIGQRELPLDVSICRHAILRPGLFVVPDLALDSRFDCNPLVTSDGGLRFYAGAPINTPEGLPLGTVCVLDIKPRPAGLADREGRVLASLARQIMSELELRRTVAERDAEVGRLRVLEEDLRASERRLKARADELAAIHAAAPVGLTVIDRDMRFVRINERLAEINGLPAADHLGRTVGEVVPDLEETAVATMNRVLAGEPLYGVEFKGTTPAQPGVVRTWRENWVPFRDSGDGIVGIIISAEEITAEKAAERLQAFRLELTERLRDLSDSHEAMNAATELLGKYLQVAQVGFGEIDAAQEHMTVQRAWNDGRIPSVRGTWRMDDFGPALVREIRAGATIGITDIRQDSRTSAPKVVAAYDAIHARSLLDVPLVRDGRWTAMLFIHHPEPRIWSAEEVALVEETCDRLWAAVERARAESLLRTSEARFRALFEQSPLLVHILDPEGRTIMANPALIQTYDIPPESVLEYNVLEDAETLANGTRELLERVFFEGEVMRTPPIRHESARQAGARRTPWIETVGFAIRNEAGEVSEVVLLSQDVTERVEAVEREKLLAREVDHRAKNLLTVVQSVVQLTRADDIGNFKAAVLGRIQSLARAHSLLAASRWEGVELRQLVSEELEPFARPTADRVHIAGPRLRLKPAAAQALALVLHELTTNAAKHGSFSTETGRVQVTWALTGPAASRRLEVHWQERDGPLVSPPGRRGFGSSLIRSSVERQLGGELALDWNAQGLSARVVLPADQLAEAPGDEPAVKVARKSGPPEPLSLHGKRVLVVEDEALIALQIEDALATLGTEVIGPAATVNEALQLLGANRPDAAVLDVNLNGERSDRVARALRLVGVPFVLCTGYAEDIDLPAPMAGAERLSKPIEPAMLVQALSALVGIGD